MGPVRIEDIGMDGKTWNAMAAVEAWQTFASWPLPLQWLFVGLFGVVIGSFLTVVIHRVPIMMARAWEAERAFDLVGPAARVDDDLVRGRALAGQAVSAQGASDVNDDQAGRRSVTTDQRFDLIQPRSHCPHCGHTLTWYENLPLLGYLLARGRCRACGTGIGLFYPTIEAATLLLALAAFWRFGAEWQALAGFGLLSTLLVLACIDARTQFLPDVITLPLLWVGLLLNLPIWSHGWHAMAAHGPATGPGASDNGSGFLLPDAIDANGAAGASGGADSGIGSLLADAAFPPRMHEGLFCPLSEAVIGAAVGYLFLWAVYWVFRLVRGKEGIGYGDFKLLAALGAWFGWTALPQIILVAALSGSVIGMAALARGRVARDEPLPFGPYLAIAGAITLLFGDLMTSLVTPWAIGL